MHELRPSDFSAFFYALWNCPPFPWQERLARRVCQGEGWPAALDLPTATGKTAAIDIAVFHLALEAARGETRGAPLRIVYVVDRRLVVDSTWERAQRIAGKLANALAGSSGDDEVLAAVARRLGSLAGEGGRPLEVARLRGGTPRETDWARTPAQPLVLCSTVDQAGSRLLFRGYGVSDSMKPVHAGLLGSDALWLIDEAHLSQPCTQTLRAVERLRRPPWVEREPPAPFGVVTLSATRDSDEPAFTLDDADEASELLHARIYAHKPARLVMHDLPAAETGKVAAVYAEQAQLLMASECAPEPAPVVGVVVNRVRLARAIFDALDSLTRATEDDTPRQADVELMIGPIRPLDRDRQLQLLLPRIRAQKRHNGRPLYLVATQTVEVGADLDFDALVTQAAPLDALRQRFGRLNRLGGPKASPAVIIATKDEVAKSYEDPVYGRAANETWNWLHGVAAADKGQRSTHSGREPVVDFGIAHLRDALTSADLKLFTTPRSDAPILLPSFVDL